MSNVERFYVNWLICREMLPYYRLQTIHMQINEFVMFKTHVKKG